MEIVALTITRRQFLILQICVLNTQNVFTLEGHTKCRKILTFDDVIHLFLIGIISDGSLVGKKKKKNICELFMKCQESRV